MILQVFSTYDRASGAYGRPMFGPAVGGMIRSFQDEVNRVGENNDLNRHPADFDLYHLGSFDDNTGRFSLFDSPEKLGNGRQYVNTKQ